MAITVESVENTFDTGGDEPTTVTQLKVTVPYAPPFFLDPDEAEQLLNAIEGVLYDIDYFKLEDFD